MATLSEKQALQRSRASCLTNVKNLNCWGSDLYNISLVREMVNLEVLNLSVNSVTTLKDLSFCPRLRELYLRKNLISNIEEIKYLKNLKNLSVIWLADNPCTLQANYREVILKNLPNLTKLDSVNVSSSEIDEASTSDACLFKVDDDLPSYDGLDLNHTLTTDAVLKYTKQVIQNVQNEQKPLILQNSEQMNTEVTKSIDLDAANQRRAELGLKELNLSCSITNGSHLTPTLNSNVETANSTLQTQSQGKKNSNVLNAIFLLMDNLNEDELHAVSKRIQSLLNIEVSLPITQGSTNDDLLVE